MTKFIRELDVEELRALIVAHALSGIDIGRPFKQEEAMVKFKIVAGSEVNASAIVILEVK